MKKIKDFLPFMENRKFSISWKSKISKLSNSPELETFKTRSFEDKLRKSSK